MKDLTGQTINGFYVLEYSGQHDSSNNRLWRVICPICKKEKLYPKYSMQVFKSCGCLLRACGSKSKKWKGVGEISAHYFNNIKHGAKARKIIFDITINEIWNMFIKQNRKCAITGVELCFPKFSDDTSCSASLDRIDSTKGYTLDNVQWVHKKIQFMKQEYSQEEFINWCKLVIEYDNRIREKYITGK